MHRAGGVLQRRSSWKGRGGRHLADAYYAVLLSPNRDARFAPMIGMRLLQRWHQDAANVTIVMRGGCCSAEAPEREGESINRKAPTLRTSRSSWPHRCNTPPAQRITIVGAQRGSRGRPGNITHHRKETRVFSFHIGNKYALHIVGRQTKPQIECQGMD